MRTSDADDRLFSPETPDYPDDHLPHQAGRGYDTVKPYRGPLAVFRGCLPKEGGLPVKVFRFSGCSKALLLGSAAYSKEQGVSASTCSQRISALKGYVRFAADKDISLQSAALSVSRAPRLKAAEEVARILAPEVLEALFDAPADSKTGVPLELVSRMLGYSATETTKVCYAIHGNAQGRNRISRKPGK